MTKNKASQSILFTGLGALLTAIVVFVRLWETLPPQMPWFYSLPDGEQQLTTKLVIAGILVGMAAMVGVTKSLAAWASKGDVPVETTLIAGSLLAVSLLVASFFRIIQIFAPW